MRIRNPLIVAALAAAAAVPALAQQDAISNKSVEASVGPLGAGLTGALRLSPDVSLRLSVNSGGIKSTADDVKVDHNHYDISERDGAGVSLLADLHPWHQSGWRLTGGVVVARTDPRLEGRPDTAGNYSINGHSYSVAQTGTLTGELKYPRPGLYLGGGWESKPSSAAGWRFVSDLGLLIKSKPDVTLTASNGAGNAALQSDLDAERDRLRKVGVGVTGSVGVAYGF